MPCSALLEAMGAAGGIPSRAEWEAALLVRRAFDKYSAGSETVRWDAVRGRHVRARSHVLCGLGDALAPVARGLGQQLPDRLAASRFVKPSCCTLLMHSTRARSASQPAAALAGLKYMAVQMETASGLRLATQWRYWMRFWL